MTASSATHTSARRASLRRRLVEWYAQECRALPLRESCDAYRI